MDKYKPTIAQPCHEDWNKMLSKDNGRYCNLCDKTIVDFTSMNTEEIISYLMINQDHQICGRLKNKERPLIHQQLIKAQEVIQTKWTKTFLRVAALFFIGLLMTTVGCQYETTTVELTESVNSTSSNDVCKKDSSLKNDTVYETTLGVILPPRDSSHNGKSIN